LPRNISSRLRPANWSLLRLAVNDISCLSMVGTARVPSTIAVRMRCAILSWGVAGEGDAKRRVRALRRKCRVVISALL
jgi:hypothetical protein